MYSKLSLFYIILIGFIILLDIDSSPSHYGYGPHYHQPYGGYQWRYSPYANYRCFSGDSLIQLSNGEYKSIDHLQSGDEIITIDQSKIISTELIMMLDKQISKRALFYTLTTESGHQISLTEYHLIPIINSDGNENYLFAKYIQIGDALLVLSNQTLNYSPVINITNEMKKGYYAPLTMKGTLLINNILASCFANVNNHHLAQSYMAPFRYYYQFARFLSFDNPFNVNQTEGLHWAVNMVFYFARYFRSDVLVL